MTGIAPAIVPFCRRFLLLLRHIGILDIFQYLLWWTSESNWNPRFFRAVRKPLRQNTKLHGYEAMLPALSFWRRKFFWLNYTRIFLLALPAYVSVCEWQFGHKNLKFSNLWSFSTPFLWSKCNDNFSPFNSPLFIHFSHS